MASNFSCIGLGVPDEAALSVLLERIHPDLVPLGKADGVEVYRWEDPSGARLVVGLLNDQLADLLPSFAGTPGVHLHDLRVLNDDVVSATVIDASGEQTTAMAFELEQRRAVTRATRWSGRAAVSVFAPDAEFFADEGAFASSRSSQMDPHDDPDGTPPPEVAERGMPWPMRMASESFISYGVFADPAQAEARARLNGHVLSAERRQNTLTGDEFVVCRIELLGCEFDLLTVPGPDPLPRAGSIVAAGSVFLSSCIDELEFPRRRGLFRRR